MKDFPAIQDRGVHLECGLSHVRIDYSPFIVEGENQILPTFESQTLLAEFPYRNTFPLTAGEHNR